MAGELGFNVKGTREAQAKLKKLAEVSMAGAKRAVDTVALEAAGVAKKLAPVDTGRLRSSIHQRNVGTLSVQVYTDVDYASAVEYGRTAGLAPPPPDALLGWMQRHGMHGGGGGANADLDLAFAVARMIGWHGIPPRPFMQPAADRARVRLPQAVESELQKAIAEAEA